MLMTAAARGWQVQVHVVGDATIDAILGLMEEVAARHPIAERRWTLMHVFLPGAAALARMKRLGLYATVQDHPVKLGHNMVRYWGEERAARSIPVRSILEAGIPTGGGTDAPVVDWNPFESIWWMTTRKIQAQGGIRVLGPDEAIGREQALRLYTQGSARTCFMEKNVGTIEPGKLADIAVLSADPLEVDDDAMRDVRSCLTIVGGKVVHRDGL
jgi:predicted amidohydrolase YtcJ